jgi:UPF0755 protein
MDIKPPPPKRKKPLLPPVEQLPQVIEPLAVVAPVRGQRITRRQLWTLVLTCAGILILIVGITATTWYSWAIAPRSTESNKVRIVVKPGDTATDIAKGLYEHDLIRSKAAFSLYSQLSGHRSRLQAGGYVFSPNQSVSSIVEHMVSGKTDEFNITIPPGLTLEELRARFKKDGFSDDEITNAFNAAYNHPLLAARPAGATLEGYVFPETYRMGAAQPLDALLTRSFDEFYEQIQAAKLPEQLAARGLNLHQGLTLASVIQKEVASVADQRQVAQVFLRRLAEGIPLQSDPTFIYPARLDGREPSIDYDSPYNTYKHAGLPPGPIANFNFSALGAIADPAPGDFLYFVADKDGVTHYSRTIDEHEANVARFCTDHCNDF